MNENLSKPLSLFLYASVFSLVINLLALIGIAQGALASIAVLIALIVQINAVSRMRRAHMRLGKAYGFLIAELIVTVFAVLLAVIGVVGGEAMGAAALAFMLLLGGIVLDVLYDFNLYWALDALNDEKQYGYPNGRIRWCFYLSLIGAGAAFLLNLVGTTFPTELIASLFAIPALVLLWQYITALRAWEQRPPLL